MNEFSQAFGPCKEEIRIKILRFRNQRWKFPLLSTLRNWNRLSYVEQAMFLSHFSVLWLQVLNNLFQPGRACFLSEWVSTILDLVENVCLGSKDKWEGRGEQGKGNLLLFPLLTPPPYPSRLTPSSLSLFATPRHFKMAADHENNKLSRLKP